MHRSLTSRALSKPHSRASASPKKDGLSYGLKSVRPLHSVKGVVATLQVSTLPQPWRSSIKVAEVHEVTDPVPVIWLQFGLDKARSHLHTDCIAKFVAYIEGNVNIG